MKGLRKSTKILILFCILWMGFIFVMSAQSSEISSEASDEVTAIIVDTVYGENKPHTAEEAGWTGEYQGVVDDIEKGLVPQNDLFGRSRFNFKNDVRKLAHIGIFFVLAVLVNITFISHYRKNKLVNVVITFGISVLYAVLDELHQMFVPGRAGLLIDIAIDAIGIIAGIILVMFCCAAVRGIKRIACGKKTTA